VDLYKRWQESISDDVYDEYMNELSHPPWALVILLVGWIVLALLFLCGGKHVVGSRLQSLAGGD